MYFCSGQRCHLLQQLQWQSHILATLGRIATMQQAKDSKQRMSKQIIFPRYLHFLLKGGGFIYHKHINGMGSFKKSYTLKSHSN